MYISNTSPSILFEYILTFLLNHTASEYGFIGPILTDNATKAPYLKTYAITNIAWNKEWRDFYDKHAPEGLEFRNLNSLFGYTMRTGKQLMTNQPQKNKHSGGLPSGHPALTCYLGMPIHSKDGLIAMYGLANRKGGYDKKVASDLHEINQIMASIIESIRNRAIIDSMAKQDQLTGAYNRFFLKEYVTKN